MACGRCGKRGHVIARAIKDAATKSPQTTIKRAAVVARSVAIDARRIVKPR